MQKVIRTQFDEKIYLIQEEPRGPSQLIEIPVTANGQTQVNFPDVPNLRNQQDQTVIIKAMRLITDTVLTNAPKGGQVTAPLAELQKISLVIYAEGWEKGLNIPVLTLNDTFTEAAGIPWRDRTMQFANWENVDWQKSFLKYSNGTVSASQPYAVLLEVEYVKINHNNGKEIIGPSL